MSPLPKISVVFITYNRMITLRPALESILAQTDYPRERLELIVADDCSSDDVQQEIRALPFDIFALGTKRGGLGANTNRGLRAATGDFILHLQDDCVCMGPPNYLRRAVSAIKRIPEVGLLILWDRDLTQFMVRDSILTPDDSILIYDNDPTREIRTSADHCYSDLPHLKSRAFIEALGPYKEVPQMWKTELDFCRPMAHTLRPKTKPLWAGKSRASHLARLQESCRKATRRAVRHVSSFVTTFQCKFSGIRL